MERIELSQAEVHDMMTSGEALAWARKTVNKVELSEREEAFGKMIDDQVNQVWKYGNAMAKSHIAEIIVKIIEPEVFDVPMELLNQIFDQGSIGEFDDIKFESKWINGLVAKQSAIRTGNVEKTYLGVMDSKREITNLEIATEFPMSELRKPNGLGVAELSLYALEAFNNAKYRFLLNFIENKVVPSTAKFTGAISEATIEPFLGYLYDNNDSATYSQVVGLSNQIRKVSKTAKNSAFYTDEMKDVLNREAKLQVLDNALLVPIKAGRKDGTGQTLIPDKKLYGFAGKVGQVFNRGELRVHVTENPNSEVFDVMFKGVEFGVAVYPEQERKIAIYTVSE